MTFATRLYARPSKICAVEQSVSSRPPALVAPAQRPILRGDSILSRAAGTGLARHSHARCRDTHDGSHHNEFVTSVPIRLVLAKGHEIVLLGLERFLSSVE